MLVRYYDVMPNHRKVKSLFEGDNLVFRTFDEIISDLFGDKPSNVKKNESTKCYRSLEHNVGLTLTIDIPGVDPSDVALTYLENKILVNYKFNAKTFNQAYTISDSYDIKTAEATMRHGQLVVDIKRRDQKPATGATVIPINTK